MEEIMEETKKGLVMINVQENSQPRFKKIFWLLAIILIFFISSMFSDEYARMVFLTANPKLLMWMGMLCLYAVYSILVEYQQVSKDIKIVEDLRADQHRINIRKIEFPLHGDQANSFFVKHFALLCKMSKDHKNGEFSSYKEKALKSEYFKANRNFKLMATILASSGMAGTIIGLMEALADMSSGADIMEGIAYALGTTLLGLFGGIVIAIMNNNFANKKEPLFYSYLDLASTQISKKGERHV